MDAAILRNIQQVFNAFNVGILIEDSNRIIQSHNIKFNQIFSLPSGVQLTGACCLDIAKQSKGFFKSPERFITDTINIPLLGQQQEEYVESNNNRIFHRRYTPVFDNGLLVAHIWSYEEVTEMKKKEQELISERAFYKTVLDEIPADIAIFSPDHKYLYLNKTAIKNDEIREWIIGKDDFEYCVYRNLDKKIAEKRNKFFNEVKAEATPRQWVDELKLPNGEPNYVMRIFNPYYNDKGVLELMIGYGINVTNQINKENELSAQRNRFFKFIETLNNGVFQIRRNGDLIFSNQYLEKYLQLNEGELGSRLNMHSLKNVHRDDRGILFRAFKNLISTQETQTGNFRVLHPLTGAVRYFDYTMWLTDTATEKDLIFGRLSDITVQKEFQYGMEVNIARERELNNLKTHFIHITSHELRTPLSVILSSAEILDMLSTLNEDERGEYDQAEFTAPIIKEVNRIIDILNELLLIGRIETGNLKYAPEWLSISCFVNKVTDEQFSPHRDGRKVDLHIDAGVDRILADKSLMRHALSNMLENAFKYSSGKQSPRLSIYQQNDNICFEVTDFGIGIPQAELKNLFQSFYRASNVGNISGTGLGLMVIDHVAKMHGGTISVESVLHQTTRLCLKIPVRYE